MAATTEDIFSEVSSAKDVSASSLGQITIWWNWLAYLYPLLCHCWFLTGWGADHSECFSPILHVVCSDGCQILSIFKLSPLILKGVCMLKNIYHFPVHAGKIMLWCSQDLGHFKQNGMTFIFQNMFNQCWFFWLAQMAVSPMLANTLCGIYNWSHDQGTL